MKIIIENEQTGNLFSKVLDNVGVDGFYCIEDDILDDFLEKMEDKYNATMDFTGGNDFIKYTIYELEDESVFDNILDEWVDFIQRYT